MTDKEKSALSVPRELVEEHAQALIEWNHATSEYPDGNADKAPNIVVTANILAVFEGGGLLRLKRKEPAPDFEIVSELQYEAGDRIEVNQHGFWWVRHDPQMRTIGNHVRTSWMPQIVKEQGSGIILLKADGAMLQIVDYHRRDDVLASNEAVKLRKLVGDKPPAPPSVTLEGFDE